MASPSQADRKIDAASEAREDALQTVLGLQHTLHNVITAARDAFERCRELEVLLAREDEHGEGGPLWTALRDLREDPAIRIRARREAVA